MQAMSAYHRCLATRLRRLRIPEDRNDIAHHRRRRRVAAWLTIDRVVLLWLLARPQGAAMRTCDWEVGAAIVAAIAIVLFAIRRRDRS